MEIDKNKLKEFNNDFVSFFIFDQKERPDFNSFIKMHFKIYNLMYKDFFSIGEYSKIALDKEEYEKYGIKLK